MESEEKGGEEGEEGRGQGREQMQRRRAARAVGLSWKAPPPTLPFPAAPWS